MYQNTSNTTNNYKKLIYKYDVKISVFVTEIDTDKMKKVYRKGEKKLYG
ncbi:hypothetical protein [Romboutsia ilealis]|nr:hypothetical protein [Romboutsia ilealis]